MEQTQLIRDLNERFRDAPAEEVVGFFLQAYKGRIALSSSLSIEDQTLTDIIVRQGGRDTPAHQGQSSHLVDGTAGVGLYQAASCPL